MDENGGDGGEGGEGARVAREGGEGGRQGREASRKRMSLEKRLKIWIYRKEEGRELRRVKRVKTEWRDRRELSKGKGRRPKE